MQGECRHVGLRTCVIAWRQRAQDMRLQGHTTRPPFQCDG